MNIEYKRILEETIVPSTLSFEEANSRYGPLANYLSLKMPDRLYRFRKFNDYSVSALENDQLWLSSGDTMNDSFDARIYYDRNKVGDWYNSLRASDGGLAPVEYALRNDDAPKEFRKVPGGEWFFNQIKSVPPDVILAYSKCLLEIIKNDIEGGLKSITNCIQSSTRFACLSSDITSDKMWGSYSESGTGFAIGYDCKVNTMVKSGGFVCLYPILYMDERIDGTDYAIYLYQVRLLLGFANTFGYSISQSLANMILPCPDQFMATKIALAKSTKWESEDEWRLFYSDNYKFDINEKHVPIGLKPSSLYLGLRMTDENRQEIMKIAQEKELPTFQMYFPENSKKYQLEYRQVL